MAKVDKKKISIALQSGSKRDVYAAWDFSYKTDGKNRVEKYSYEWEYLTSATNKWFDGGTGSVDHPTMTATYSTPSNATKVRFRVKPESKTYKSDDKDATYFTGTWSDWIVFSKFIFIASPKEYQVSHKVLKIKAYLDGSVSDSRPYVIAKWSIENFDKIDFLKNYEYKWEYYDTSLKKYVDAENGSGSTPDITADQRKKVKKGETVELTEKYFIATGEIHDRHVALYNKIRFSVTPVATDDGGDAFKPVVQRESKEIKFKTLKIEEITISAAKNSNDYTVFWYVDSNNVEHISSFDVQWQYDTDEQNYFNTITPEHGEDIWTTGGSGSVNEGDYFSNETSHRAGWSYSFTPPYTEHTDAHGDTIRTYPDVRVRIKAICDDTKSFLEDYSDWIYYSPDIPWLDVKELTLEATNPISPRHITASWTIEQSTYIASFSYEWRYKRDSKGVYSTYSTGSVDYSAFQSINTNKKKRWAIEFDAPSDATIIEFRVKPVPTYDTAFCPSYTEELFSVAKVKVLTVEGVNIQIYNASDRIVYASWDALDSLQLFSQGVKLSDLGIPGNVSDYPAESLKTLVNSVILTNYEVKWQYYYLDSWFEGSGSSSTSSTNSQYTVPDEATKIRVYVKPVSAKEEIFVGAFSKPVSKSITPSSKRLDANYLSVEWYGVDDNVVVARFTDLDSVPTVSNSKVDVIFEWIGYKYGAWDQTTIAEETITPVDELDFVMSTYTVPDNVVDVKVRVKPVIDNLEYYGVYSSYKEFPIEIDSVSVVDLTVSIQKGSKRTCVATWEDPELVITRDMVENYSYEWQYKIDEIWYDGSSGDASTTALNSTYDAPDNAETVRVRVKPNPKVTQYFIGEWTEYEVFPVPDDITPDVPDVPSIEVIDGYTFKSTVDSYDDKTSAIRFEVVNEVGVWRTADVDLLLNRAEFQFDVAAGHKYRVRAAGINTEKEVGEWSNYSSDQASYPPPLDVAPTVIALSESSVELTWNVPSIGKITSYKIEYAKKKSYFDAAPEQVQNADRDYGVTRAELIDMDASEWFFRMCTVNDSGQSDWSEIVSVVLGSTPTAPTTWSSRTTAKLGDDIYLYWTHNCADESAESSAILSITINGTTTELEITPPEDGSTSFYLISGSDINQESVIEWKVKTAGVLKEYNSTSGEYDPVYGDWSTQRIIKVFSPPSLQIVIGGQNNWAWDTFNFNSDNIYDATGSIIPIANGVVTSFPVLVYLYSYPASQTPTSYIVSVTSNNSYTEVDDTGMLRMVNIGQEIFKKYYNTQKKSYMTMLLPDNINLENSMSYTITATVSMDSGLTAEVSTSFSVSWEDEEYELNAEMSLDEETLTTTIRPYALDSSGAYPSNVTLSVYRREFDGAFVAIGTKLSNTTRPVVVDPHPALDYARYRIVAQSNTTGAISYYDLPGLPINEPGIVLQWDEQWTSYNEINADAFSERPWTGSMIKLPYNVKISDSNTVDIESVEYIGRKHPVSYYGTQVGQKASWTSDIPKSDKELIYALRRLAVYMGNVYVREPNGSGYWAHVEVSFSIDYDSVIIPVSLDITRVEGGM